VCTGSGCQNTGTTTTAAAATTTVAPSNTHHVCGQEGSLFYDIQDTPSAATLTRYSSLNPPTVKDTNTYASIAMPAPGANWGDGIAYAATMQTRGVWMYSDPTTSATWTHDSTTGFDTWVFTHQPAGSPVLTVTLTTGQCSNTVHVCGQEGSLFYDIQDTPSGTTLTRYSSMNPPTVKDTNTYASIAMPAPGANWGDGIAYAATMQTRGVWMYSDPTTSATWTHDSTTGFDTWVFQHQPAGSPVLSVTLTTGSCPSP
jgi:hypothetical protein